jgi:hypothetical protein
MPDKNKEEYDSLVEQMGLIGAPAWEDLPPNDPARKIVEARVREREEDKQLSVVPEQEAEADSDES